MWSRLCEITLALWLVASPFIFRHDPSALSLWLTDFGCAAAVLLFALLSYKPSLEKMHLLQGVVALWLLVSAFLAPASPTPPAYQNHAVVGLLLVLFAVVPSRSSQPPRGWREFYEQRSK